MVGIRDSFLLGPGLFSGATVGGRNPIPNHLECIKTYKNPLNNGISTTNLNWCNLCNLGPSKVLVVGLGSAQKHQHLNHVGSDHHGNGTWLVVVGHQGSTRLISAWWLNQPTPNWKKMHIRQIGNHLPYFYRGEQSKKCLRKATTPSHFCWKLVSVREKMGGFKLWNNVSGKYLVKCDVVFFSGFRNSKSISHCKYGSKTCLVGPHHSLIRVHGPNPADLLEWWRYR